MAAAYDAQKRWTDFRVGLITLSAIVMISGLILFAGGDKGIFFQDTATLNAKLFDVGGLKKGNSVTMAGMTIGRVSNVSFSEDNEHCVIVRMSVRKSTLRHIKEDSVPSIRTQGMMGDRYIDIAKGSDNAQPVVPGATIYGDSASDFDKTLKQANSVLNETERVLSAINQEEGTMGRIFYDEKLYQGMTQLSDELNELIRDFKKNPRRYIKFSLF